MNSLPKLTEAAIRERTSDAAFERGEEYCEEAAVKEIALSGDLIIAEVEGSVYGPYQVVISMSEDEIEDTGCTCPYNWGGDCKHVVAVLLTCLRKPEEVEFLPSAKSMLARLDHVDLLALAFELMTHRPGLAIFVHRYIHSLKEGAEEVPRRKPPRVW